jgi:hypothetical protein
MSVPVQPDNRFNRPNNTCPICGGWERSNPQCKGYLGDKEGVVFCTNSQYAGALPRGDTGQYRHWTGNAVCKCGVAHLTTTFNSSKPKAEPMMNNEGRPKKVEETYPYGDGCFVDRVSLGYEKDGKPAKDFYQYKVTGGKKVYQGFKKLYRIAEVKAAGKPYLVAEGERKVNKLVDMGFVATCNVGGAGSWVDAYADELPAGPGGFSLAGQRRSREEVGQ